MAKTALEQWDETAANNTDVGSVNIDEGCAPSGMNNAHREEMSQFAKWLGDDTLASAATTDLGSVPGRYVSVTGTTTITALGTIKAGTIKYVKFAGILTFTHNAASLILPGAANITTAAGDTAIMVSEGSGNWRCLSYTRAAAAPYVSGTFTATLTCGTSGTITLGGAACSYIKIGRLVTVEGELSVNSVSAPNGLLTLGTFPFTSGGSPRSFSLYITGFVGTAGIVWQGNMQTTATTAGINFYSQSTGAAGGNPSGLMQAGTNIQFSLTYSAAA